MNDHAEKPQTDAARSDSARPSRFRIFVTALLMLFAFWRIAVCFYEYNIGPYVTVGRATIDLIPFIQFAVCAYLLASRDLGSTAVRVLLAIASLTTLLTIVDLSITCSQMPNRLTSGTWATPEYISKVVPQRSWTVDFRDDGQARMTGPGGVTVSRPWGLEMDGFRFVPRVTIGTNGYGELLKGGEIHLIVHVGQEMTQATIDTYIDGPTNPAAFHSSWIDP